MNKDIPEKPINVTYCSRDGETFADCPNCREHSLFSGWFTNTTKCPKCGQLIDWRTY